MLTAGISKSWMRTLNSSLHQDWLHDQIEDPVGRCSIIQCWRHEWLCVLCLINMLGSCGNEMSHGASAGPQALIVAQPQHSATRSSMHISSYPCNCNDGFPMLPSARYTCASVARP